jgi:hypothetical protein
MRTILLVMASEQGQVEQETYDEGRLSERIMLAAAAYDVGSSIGWFTGSGRAAAKTILGVPKEKLVRTASPLATRMKKRYVPVQSVHRPASL